MPIVDVEDLLVAVVECRCLLLVVEVKTRNFRNLTYL